MKAAWKHKFVIAGFFCVPILIFALIYGRPVIQNDGLTYYALTISLVSDLDFDLSNQHQTLPDLRVFQKADGSFASVYSCGFALLYAPFLKLFLWLELISTDLASWKPYAQNAIIPFSHALAIFSGTILFGLFTLIAGYRFLTTVNGANRISAAAITTGVFAGTPLIFYTFTTPSFAHTADAFLVSIGSLIAAQTLTKQDAVKPAPQTVMNILLGFVLAFSIVLRNHNLVLALVISWGILIHEGIKDRKFPLKTVAEFAIGALPLIFVQVIFNLGQYGNVFATGYNARPIDDFGMHLRSALNFHQLLIHPAAGAFIWSPIIAISFVGLIAGAWKRKPVSIVFLIAVCAVVFSISFGWIAWPGSTFGQRLLTHLYIFWTAGLYEAYLLLKKPVIILGAAAVLWSFILFNLYYINFAFPENRRVLAENARVVTPALVLENAKSSYASFINSGKGGWLSFWWTSLQARPYPNLQYILRQPEFDKPQRKQKLKRRQRGE